MNNWQRWVAYFIGTPQKVSGWLIIVGVIYIACNPGILTTLVNNLVGEINGILQGLTPLFGQLLVIGIIVYALKKMFKGSLK
ncbi:MAG: hypothetical protein HGB03_01860 [Candidatus Yonathbacteria bacterium]|nr:hypothetical protein [Candidatus Yonathbacteria bacterium]NTW48005.1 hypothetical protein [Candidatus Yonathbacteria bacterium]